PDGAADRHADADLPLFRGEALHPPRQLRVLGLPDDVARPDQPQVERALTGTAEDELPRPGVEHVAGVQPAPRLVALGLPLVEEDAVAGLELRSAGLGPDQDVPGPGVDLLHPSHQNPAGARIEPVHQLPVLGSSEKAVAEAAREAVAQLLLVAPGAGGRAPFHRRL